MLFSNIPITVTFNLEYKANQIQHFHNVYAVQSRSMNGLLYEYVFLESGDFVNFLNNFK